MASSNGAYFQLSIEEEDKAYMHALELAASCMMNMTLRATLELGILDVIVNAGPGAKLTATQIVSQLPTVANPEAPNIVGRMLRLLAAHNIVDCEVEDGGLTCKYGAAPVCKYFIRSEDEASLAHVVFLGTDMVYLKCGSHFKDAIVKGGTAFDNAFNMSLFEYTKIDPRFSNVFNVAMKGNSIHIVRKVIDTYEGFKDIKTLVDVGGGIGTTISMITAKYPHIKGINFDLPHVISNAKTYPGVEFIGGDMLESVPMGDAIFMKNILHNWDDEQCLKILKNCYDSLPQHGKMIIVECILPEAPELTNSSKFFTCYDLVMLTHFGAKQRTKEAFEELCRNAGFQGLKTSYFLSYFAIIEFTK